ncbi:oligopeptide transporter [Pseudovirgaria hyperparasitica]|uniref:Oligopeptide transporter n=1 Tax=Pseudovirgaria hyperparasitica TaxID=470096 RepID=A0A6A6W603_9PEZI|nr:oligopeptide transporter [Pseudovirgaria hyperparasitica]KAF2757380.1 oligopeptide transporter [Pseudovirgaria hyperparasitica]
MSTTEVLDRPLAPMGFIDPAVSPMKEKDDVFNHPAQTSNEKEIESKEIDSVAEKEVDEDLDADKEADGNASFMQDPFRPFDNLPPEQHRVLTIRAVFVGLCCGALVNASNVYLGLKTGWTFTANLFGAIVGFAVIKFFSRTFAENFPILGGNFGPRENNIVQTAAMASGGLSNVFVSALPALYQLNLMGDNPKADYWKIVSLTAVGGYFGFFFATPLRKFFVIYVARELRLIFPTASATAMTIRSMHEAVTGEAIAKLKMRALSAAFSAALVLRVVSQYAIGILWDWHVFTWFFIWGNYNNSALAAENWGWIIEFTPAFIGSGMLVGLNVSISFFMGSVIAWGIIGPSLVAQGMAFGRPAASVEDGYGPEWSGYISYASLSKAFSNKDTPSPRYWLLWPGVLLMIAVSFTELFLQYKIIFFAFRAVFRGTCQGISAAGHALGKKMPWFEKRAEQEVNDLVEDPAPVEEQVKWWMWSPGLILSIICICVVLGVEFDMPIGMSLLSVVLTFFFSFLAIQCTGVTDITPLTAASKASQIVLGGATKGEGWEQAHAQKLNLLGGAIANMGANQSTDLVCDFRTGFLLRTPPNQQWIAQGVGTVVAIFLAPAMFVLFASAYPCILNTEIEICPFSVPSVAAWRATAVAVTDPTFPIPKSSGIFAIVFAIFGSAMVFVRHFLWVGKWEWMRAYHPNMMCIGLAFVLPQTYYGTAMCLGAIPSYYWAKKNPKSFDIYGYAIAAGLIAGEGIGGVINALFQVVGIAGPDPYGTQIACPARIC